MISRLVKITAILFALGSALPVFAFGDDIGMTFKPDGPRSKIVRVLARIVDHYADDQERAVLVEPRDRRNNTKLSGLIKSLKESNGKQIEGTFRIKGKPLHKVIYIFDEDNKQLKVRVDNINYIISELKFLDIED